MRCLWIDLALEALQLARCLCQSLARLFPLTLLTHPVPFLPILGVARA